METGAVVVAAGMSSRMGEFKPMLSIGSISIAQRVIATLRQAGASRIVVVTGYNAEELEWHLARSGVIFLRNEHYRTTHMFDSALIGLRYLLASGAELACPVCGGSRGHPILMSAGVIDRILDDSGEGGLQGALSRCGVPMTFVEVDDPGILHDADTPEDYRELLELHNRQLGRPVLQIAVAREKKFLDSRVAMLLALTDETSSVRLACQRMQLSYSSGWNSINLLEKELGYAVVVRTQGGPKGGRSELTPKGRELLRAYEAYTQRVRATADELFAEYFPDLFKN